MAARAYFCIPEFAHHTDFHRAAQLRCHCLHAIAYAQHRHAQTEHRLRYARGITLGYGIGSTGKNNAGRIEIFNKVLSLPIGYFTEQKKGDLMQRMTGDVGQVESSVIGALEGWVKDPLQIIINLIVL